MLQLYGYNAYLIVGRDKAALIDTVKRGFEDQLLSNIEKVVGGRDKRIDIVVVNHVEPDHTGALPKIVERFSPEIGL